MKKVFYFIAKKLSYTSSIAIFSLLIIWLGTIFGYFMGIAFITSAYYEMIFDDILRWFPVTGLITTAAYLLSFGILTPFKIPALTRSLRLINNSFEGDRLKNIEDNDLLRELLEAMSFLPIICTIASAFFVVFFGILTGIFIFIDTYMSDSFSFVLVREILGTGLIGSGVTAIISGMLCYLFTDIITNHDKTNCYHELRDRGIRIPPVANIRISIKLGFFLLLMIISLLIFGSQIERGRYYGETDITLLVVYFLVTVLIGFILMSVNANSILRIVADLRRVAREIAAGGEGKFQFLPSESEFADIEYTIMEMKREIDENRKTLEAKVEDRTKELNAALLDLREKDDLVQRQLDMAGTIQRGILPGKIEAWNGVNFAVRYIAMEKIGGDFYDVYPLKENKMSLLIADVSGHGIPAALVTAMAKISFGNAHLKYDSPRRIFQEVNHDMLDHVKTQDYLTCFLLVIDDDYNVTYSNASHQKAMLLRTEEGKIELMDTNGLFIGAIKEANETYEEKSVKLNYGDRIILYTDGIPEAVNDKNEEYTNERLEEMALKHRNLPLEEFIDSLVLDLQNFMGVTPMQDDVTLLIVELEKDEALEIMRTVKHLINENKFNEAIDRLRSGLALYPDNQKLLYNLGKNYFRVNDIENAIACFSRYVEKDKTNKYAYYIGGTAYYQKKDYDNAVRFLEEAVKLDPNFVNAMFAAGMVYKTLGKTAEAVSCFEKVVDIDGTNKKAMLELKELKGAA